MDKIKYDYTAYLLHEQYGTHDTNYICSCGMRMDFFVGIVKEELLPGMLMFLGSKYFQTKYVEFCQKLALADNSVPLRIVKYCLSGQATDIPDQLKDKLSETIKIVDDSLKKR